MSVQVTPDLSKDASILIVGTGTFGLSTAVHLARRGYTNIQCLDKWAYPSPDSAGYDINKIIGMRNDTPLAARTSREAFAAWQEPLFKEVFHQVGLITSATNVEATEYCKGAYKSWIECGEEENVVWLEEKKDFHDLVPQLRDGGVDGWRGFFHKRAGWAHARDAMKVMGDEAKKMGVRFATGKEATMEKLLLDAAGEAVGIIAVDGTEWKAERIVLCTGAWSDSLIDTKGQLEAKCWTVAHIQLTPEECAEFKDMPVVMNLEEGKTQQITNVYWLTTYLGFFFEPDGEGQVKICNEFPGFTNFETVADGRSVSVPRSHATNPSDRIPNKSRDEVRSLLSRTIPRFSGHSFVVEKVCWCTDTMDRNWLVDVHPVHDRLIIATGDSGNAFKMLPVIGKYIGDLVQGRELDSLVKEAWKWREDKAGRSERFGGDGKTRDLKEMDGWKAD